MARFILLTFGFLGWAFYEMSGGSQFEPASARLTNIKTDPLKPQIASLVEEDKLEGLEAQVTRVSLNLTTVEDVLSGNSRVPAKLPQQDVTQTAELPAPAQGESVAIIPSLVAGVDPVSDVVPVSATLDQGFDIRTVTGNRVNVRGGPGTNFGVVSRLVRGDEVEILEDNGEGWVRFRALDTDEQGWIADFLLSNG